jgi:hypothetical protein
MAIDDVQDLAPRVQYTALAAQTVFDYDFPIFEEGDLVVDVNDDPQALGTDYTVQNEGEDEGGTVTFLTPLAGGETVTIYRDIPIARTSDYQQNGPWSSASTNAELNRIVMMLQQLESSIGRSLRLPMTANIPNADIELSPLASWLNKYVFIGANGTPEPATAVATTTLSQSVIGALLYPLTEAEDDAGIVTLANMALPPYWRGRYLTWADFTAACDEADAEGLIEPEGYTLTGNITLPRKVRCIGALAGAFTVTYTQQSAGGYVDGLTLSDNGATLILSGVQRCAFLNIRCRKVEIDGFNSSYGFFWNVMIGWMVEEVEADITLWAINQNTWIACVMRYFHTEGDTSTYAATEFNANKLFACDFSNYGDASLPVAGCRQNDSVGRKNTLYGPYIEVANSAIVGNWVVYDLHSDGDQPPEVGLDCHVFGGNSNNEKTAGDYLSISTVNMITGGDWRVRGSDNKPPSYGHTGGASVSVQADATEPFGAGSRYEATFADAGDRFTIQVRGSGRTTCSGYVFYKSASDFVQIDVTDGTSTASLTARPVVIDAVNNWKMVRFRGPAHAVNGAGVSLYAYAGVGGAAKTMSLGSSSAGAEQACVTPQRPEITRRFARATVNPASLTDGTWTAPVTITVTGAALGDVVDSSFSLDLQAVQLKAYVSAANTVAYTFGNETGGTIDLGEGEVYVEARTRLS